MGIAEMILAFLSSFLIIFIWNWNRNSAITRNWPVLGMLPGLLQNSWHLHDFFTHDYLEKSRGTFEFKGPWFAKMDFFITSDPMNVYHISSKNFSNYPKGDEFRMIMEPLGDSIFNADGDLWKTQRKMIHSLMKHKKFESALERNIYQKVAKGLIPILEHVSEREMMVDLQDVFQRFTFDNSCMLVLGFDPNYLSVDFPHVSLANTYHIMEAAALYRHIVPNSWWKLQELLEIGEQKKLTSSWRTFDEFLYKCISSNRARLSRRKALEEEEEEFDLLTTFIVENEKEKEVEDDEQISALRKTDKFIRDVAFGLLGAGNDTVSSGLVWFFWLVATHPSVEHKILEEIKANVIHKEEDGLLFNAKQVNRLVYLHAALCETLRLYPPVPYNHKIAAEAEILPSGHHINQNERLLISYYAMGRMEEIWGKDCLKFKPERWISEEGCIVHVPSYKFAAFHAGPRNCPGKDAALIQMKMVAIAVISNYHVKVVQSHSISPSNSIILRMKYGLNVYVSKRNLF